MPEVAQPRKHISVSQLEMFQRCGVQYEFRYVQGLNMPPGSAAIRGKGVHKGAEHNYRHKIEHKVDLPTDEVVDVAVQTVKDQFHGGVILTPEEATTGIKKVQAATVDIAARLTRLHQVKVSPQVQPIMAERKITLHADPEYLDRDLVGVVDLITDADEIPDLKTSGRTPSQEDVDADQQLTTMALLFRSLTGRTERSVGLVTLIPGEPGKERVDIKASTRDVKDIEVLVKRMQRAVKMIDAGMFMPTNPRNWWCSAKWCGYWPVCPFVRGNQRKAV